MKYNHKSDFDFILTLKDGEGNDIGWPAFDFRLLVATPLSKPYEASKIGDECVNLFNDEGRVHVVCDNHGLLPGNIKVTVVADLDNIIYPDGKQRIVRPMLAEDIELTQGVGDEPLTGNMDGSIPIAILTAYDLAVRNGYAGTLEQYLRATLELVETVDLAKESVQTSAQAVLEAEGAVERAVAAVGDAETATANAIQAIDAKVDNLVVKDTNGTFADGDLLRWDASRQMAVPLNLTIEDIDVVYDDESTEKFYVLCKTADNADAD